MNRAAVYVKGPSRSHQDEADAETQMGEVCKAKGLEATIPYKDGKLRREEFQRTMADADAEEQEFDHVVVRKLARLAMELEESLLARETEKSHGAGGCQ